MIEAVFVFALINIGAEFVLLCMVPPKWRLRLLGSEGAQLALHLMIMILVLMVHWGTLVGTMAAFLSFMASLGTVAVARALFGNIKQGRYYHRGLVAYSASELK